MKFGLTKSRSLIDNQSQYFKNLLSNAEKENDERVYFIYFDEEGALQNGDLKMTAKQVSLFPIIPSVTWNFKF